jgi:ABC-2 type transport system ATP-binding protein
MTGRAVAEFLDVVKVYPTSGGELRAVDGVCLTVEPGEVLGLIGPNRSGKTTLAKLLVSLCRPTSGAVLRFGRPGDDIATLARVGYVHEAPSFPAFLTPQRLLDDHGALAGVSARDRRCRIPALLKQFGLFDRAREPVDRFSKGMLARLALAYALVNDPTLLVLDEPTGGLDVEGRTLLRAVLGDARRRGGSVVLISHDLDEVERVCDRVAVLNGGRLVPGRSGPVPDVTLLLAEAAAP